MTVETVTFDIPRRTYERIKRAAEKKHRAVNDVLAEAVTAVAPVIDTDAIDLQTALAQLTYLNFTLLIELERYE